jgi:hypothetical protein
VQELLTNKALQANSVVPGTAAIFVRRRPWSASSDGGDTSQGRRKELCRPIRGQRNIRRHIHPVRDDKEGEASPPTCPATLATRVIELVSIRRSPRSRNEATASLVEEAGGADDGSERLRRTAAPRVSLKSITCFSSK